MGIKNFVLETSKVRKTEKIAVLNTDWHTPIFPTPTQKYLFATLQLSSPPPKKSNYS